MTTKSRKTPITAPHRLHQMLHHLGWSLGALENAQPLAWGHGTTAARGSWQAALLPDGQVLLLIRTENPLPQLGESFKRYEDLAPMHAELRSALQRERIAGRHVLLFDPVMGAQLIDFAQEDVLLDARGEDEVTDRLLPILNLNALAKGSLVSFPRKTPHHRARELADWTKIWSARIGAASASSPEIARQFLFWMHLTRLVEHLGLLSAKGSGFAEYPLTPKVVNPVRFLTRIFTPLHRDWNLLQGAPLEVHRQIAHRAHEAEQLAPCLESYSRISRSKFSAAIFAEAFADEELRLASWRGSIMESPAAALDDPALRLIEPTTINLDQTGFAVLFSHFDAIAEDLRRLARDQAVAAERGARPGLQMDAFASVPPAILEEEAPRLALQVGLRVKTSRRDRGEVARLALLAHAAEWHARIGRAAPIFPAPRIDTPAAPPPPRRPPADPSLN